MPGSEYVERANQLDLRFSKILRIAKYRTLAQFRSRERVERERRPGSERHVRNHVAGRR
jgi:hypothetical protein